LPIEKDREHHTTAVDPGQGFPEQNKATVQTRDGTSPSISLGNLGSASVGLQPIKP